MHQGGREMIRQAINCDICGAEKLEATSHWFVAYEQAGEMMLRGWESPKNSRKNVKHLCGQKCVQHIAATFTASVMAVGHVSKQGKEAPAEIPETTIGDASDREDMPVLERMGYDRETAILIEADSWAGPAKSKENSWESEKKLKTERERLINAARMKSQMARPFQRMA
jgi:hypothetical protein